MAANGRIVSYDLIINGRPSERHRKFLEWKIPVMILTFLTVVVMWRIFMLRVYRESKPESRLGQVMPGQVM